MKRKNFSKRILAVLVSLISLALATIYLWSAATGNRKYNIALTAVETGCDAACITEGNRLVKIKHCSDCHEDRLSAGDVESFAALNLTQIIPTYAEAGLQRLLKYGRLVYAMPIYVFHKLSDESYTKIISYLRALKPFPSTPGISAKNSYCFLRRLQVTCGDIYPGMVTPEVPGSYIGRGTSAVSPGQYLVMTTCTSCHGADLRGLQGFSPDLIIASADSWKDFFRLLRTEIATGGSALGLLTKITKDNLRYPGGREINATDAYLKTQPTLKQERLK